MTWKGEILSELKAHWNLWNDELGHMSMEEFMGTQDVFDVSLMISPSGKFKDAKLLMGSGGDTVILEVEDLRLIVSSMDVSVEGLIENEELSKSLFEHYKEMYCNISNVL